MRDSGANCFASTIHNSCHQGTKNSELKFSIFFNFVFVALWSVNYSGQLTYRSKPHILIHQPNQRVGFRHVFGRIGDGKAIHAAHARYGLEDISARG